MNDRLDHILSEIQRKNEQNNEIRFSADRVPGGESRRYYVKDKYGYTLFHLKLVEPGYEKVITTIDGDLAESWLRGELIVARYDRGAEND